MQSMPITVFVRPSKKVMEKAAPALEKLSESEKVGHIYVYMYIYIYILLLLLIIIIIIMIIKIIQIIIIIMITIITS